MGADTKIEWCDHTFNPWTGCTKVSPGCANCYAEAWSKRSGVVEWGPEGTRRRTSDANWRQPHKWNQAAQRDGVRRKVFCASLADVFEDREELKLWRLELLGLIVETPQLDWLLLTKRPENAAPFFTAFYGSGRPWPNIWLGTSVENQAAADERIPQLLQAPAVVHFLSCEPLLGPLDLTKWTMDGDCQLDWIIVGGESGQGARPCELQWIREIKLQCDERHALFVKQLGAVPVVERIDGVPGPWRRRRGSMVRTAGGTIKALGLKDKKGGDWEEWPEDLRVREFPR